jgi:hypothetical protein
LPQAVAARRELAGLRFGLGLDDSDDARRAYLGTLGRTTRLCERAGALLDELDKAGLRVLPYKGAVFADALYGDRGLRGLGDIDFLVEDIDAASALVERRGFSRLYVGRERFTPRHGHDRAFVASDDPDVTVELHYRLGHELAGDASLDGFFARAITVETLGRARLVPSWSDHLFAVALHAASHAFGDHPGWVIDFVLLAQKAEIGTARAEAHRRGYGAAFDTAARLADAALPGLIDVPAATVADRLRLVLLHAALGDEPLAQPATRLPSLIARAALTDRPVDAAREVWRKLRLRAYEAWTGGVGRRFQP